MITDIAQIDVIAGMESQFEAGVREAIPLFKRAKGCGGLRLERSHETPQRYRLFITWETLENHTVDFRQSADFPEWRKLVGDCFAEPPYVEHVAEVGGGDGLGERPGEGSGEDHLDPVPHPLPVQPVVGEERELQRCHRALDGYVGRVHHQPAVVEPRQGVPQRRRAVEGVEVEDAAPPQLPVHAGGLGRTR